MLTSFTSIFSSHFYVPNQIGFPNDDNISIKNEALQKVALPDLCDSYACVCNIFYKSINQNLAKSTNSCISRYQIHQWTGISFNFNMSSLVLDVAQHCQHAWLLWPGRTGQGCNCQTQHLSIQKVLLKKEVQDHIRLPRLVWKLYSQRRWVKWYRGKKSLLLSNSFLYLSGISAKLQERFIITMKFWKCS